MHVQICYIGMNASYQSERELYFVLLLTLLICYLDAHG